MRARVITAALAVTVLGAGCTPTLDTEGLEEQILSLLEERGGSAVTSVDCPEDVEAEAGGSFECTATGEDGEWVVSVTQVDDEGNVEIEVGEPS